MNNDRIGGIFDEFLRDEGFYEDAEAVAVKRVIAFQISVRWSSLTSPSRSSRDG